MPLSANSPEGQVTLVGLDLLSIEQLRDRNRKDRIFTAKCCGAPVQVRTAAGRIPHFVHLSTPDHCEGDKKETPEHRRLKHDVAAAVLTAGWEVETEAGERDPETGKVKWRADVLATRGKVRIAFEIQLSNADWSSMMERQKRYQRSGVRALWLVKTQKNFPTTKELPIFVINGFHGKDWIYLPTRLDDRFTWHESEGKNQLELPDFIQSALGGRLKWSPYLANTESMLEAVASYAPVGGCEGCSRTLVRPLTVKAHFLDDRWYPGFYWRPDVTVISKSNWPIELIQVIWNTAAEESDLALISPTGVCMWCGVVHTQKERLLRGAAQKLSAQVQLGSLPAPEAGTVEWDWLNRWVLI